MTVELIWMIGQGVVLLSLGWGVFAWHAARTDAMARDLRAEINGAKLQHEHMDAALQQLTTEIHLNSARGSKLDEFRQEIRADIRSLKDEWKKEHEAQEARRRESDRLIFDKLDRITSDMARIAARRATDAPT